jgi:HAD superfamily hydrolase (TIGR01459 family)
MLQFDLHRHAAQPISGLGEIAGRYDVVLCDVWGVVHNGMQHYPEAVDALARFREGGGAVVLITNAPRPASGIQRMLERLRVPRDAYDSIVSSGDVTVSLMLDRGERPVHHVGPPRDNSLFREVAVRSGGPDPRVPFDVADYVVCTGLLDDVNDTLEDYDPLLRRMREKQMEFICANPDIVVHSGERLIYCAGAIAERYAALGGPVIQAGKPYPEIYRHRRCRGSSPRHQRPPPRSRHRRRACDRSQGRDRRRDRHAVRLIRHSPRPAASRGSLRHSARSRDAVGAPRRVWRQTADGHDRDACLVILTPPRRRR